MRSVTDAEAKTLLARFGLLRRHQRRDGTRSPHKPLLVLLALGKVAATASSELPWSAAEAELGELIAEFGPPSSTGRAQSAAYPFTRLRNDQVWVLDQDVAMDLVGPLTSHHVIPVHVVPLGRGRHLDVRMSRGGEAVGGAGEDAPVGRLGG